MSADPVSLVEARAWLRERVSEGAQCPCCTQFAKLYRRRLTGTGARALIALYRAGSDFHHLPTIAKTRLADVAHQGGYLTLSQHWGLIEEESTVRDDGGRVGWWRVTQRGAQFVRGHRSVAKYALIYDSRCLGLEGDPVTIHDALGSRFSYEELMSA